MIPTINNKVYGDLLAQYQPKIITTEEENERALAVVESLTHKNNLTPEEDQLLELLVTLIEKFEIEHYPLNNLSTPLSRLTFLMEENNLRFSDVVEIFGSKGIASEVLKGKRQISKSHALKLGEFFNLNPALFLI
ncbi:MAG: transcriptional regulator [Hydrococcus sp. Prado102]|jgi:HTH-type transcriptional regulator/antitoxin HigA|nr:transcriptional regulator [Hydrococcus sp. Prado102]